MGLEPLHYIIALFLMLLPARTERSDTYINSICKENDKILQAGVDISIILEITDAEEAASIVEPTTSPYYSDTSYIDDETSGECGYNYAVDSVPFFRKMHYRLLQHNQLPPLSDVDYWPDANEVIQAQAKLYELDLLAYNKMWLLTYTAHAANCTPEHMFWQYRHIKIIREDINWLKTSWDRLQFIRTDTYGKRVWLKRQWLDELKKNLGEVKYNSHYLPHTPYWFDTTLYQIEP